MKFPGVAGPLGARWSSYRLRSLLAIAIISISAFAQAEAQRRQALSLTGKPKSEASAFVISELDLLVRLANSRQTTEILFHNGDRLFGDDFGIIGCVGADLGLMLNLSPRSSLGFSGFVALEEFRHRAGARLRYRFWDIGAGNIELSFGPAFDITQHEFTENLNRRQWVVGTLSFSQSRIVHILFRAESHLQDFPPDRRVTAAYVGLKFGY